VQRADDPSPFPHFTILEALPGLTPDFLEVLDELGATKYLTVDALTRSVVVQDVQPGGTGHAGDVWVKGVSQDQTGLRYMWKLGANSLFEAQIESQTLLDFLGLS
jgi:hypothetical protein